ncbi:GNAT family N-acetyltransferase [Actinoplanes sp. NBRC 103695]|uniref:GNAT family N-acetyltransferase n=1 Tax=Actinoplanes sp. NBRC 103695 TaxID=3032202 RepID=UPI0024A1BE1F|nr:GNAT family N-acetyltransferase [Actinoplanes sp. NBRC 103695]GLY99084.1 hypothetical protein Acsp02_63380 [Actinoplanes sp. NBRC 103695]
MPRPPIRINQLGYLPSAPKRATWMTDAASPQPFAVYDGGGEVVLRGRSVPTSDPSAHLLDFTALGAGEGFRVVAGGERSHPFRVAADLYEGLSRDSLRLFTLLRCEHAGDVAVPGWTGIYPDWRPSGVFDVSGGWYDAGDYGKYAVSGAIALWQLLDLVRLLGAHGRDATTVVEECRWQLDWLLRMRVPAGQPYAGLVFHRVHGTEWSPIPGRPDDDPTTRVLHRPSTAATLHLVAVCLKASRVLDDPSLVEVARTAWHAARSNPELIAPDDEGRFGGGPYGDPDLTDDWAWAGAEQGLPTDIPPPADLDGFDFDRVSVPAMLDLERDVVPLADRLLDLQRRQPWGQPYAPEAGWHWGSNGRILNNLVVLARAHEMTGDRRYRDGVLSGVDYLLGRNALGQSFVVGYGTDATAHLRTRQFGDHPPAGALAGGANSIPTPGFPSDPRLDGLPPECRYLDENTSETTNDLCIRWNAPLAYVTAYLSLLEPPPAIDAGAVVLRRWDPRWSAEVTAAVRESLDEIGRFLSWATEDYDLETARDFIEREVRLWAEGTNFDYAIFTAAGELAGSAGLMTRMGPGVLEVGYWLRTSRTGRGYMTAAVDALARMALALPGVDRVALRHDAGNTRSAAVAERTGFVEVERASRRPEAPGHTGVEVIRERR